MPRYIEVDAESLSKLHAGLTLLEQVDRDAMRTLDLFLYGLTNNPEIVDAAKEAIADDAEVEESDVQLTEVAVAIPMGSDIIYYLDGSGLILRREDFAYMGSGGEGIRQMSLASSHAWLDDFLRKEGSGQAATVKQNVHRTEEATQPGVPEQQAAPPAPAAPQAPAQQQIPKQTSLRTLASLLDEFLD